MKKIRIFSILSIILLVMGITFFILALLTPIEMYIAYISAFIAGIGFLGLIFSPSFNNLKNQINWLEERVKLGNSISYRVKVAGEKSFNEMPIGIVVYSNDFRIEWANNFAKQIFMSTLVERKISNISQELDVKVRTLADFNVEIYGKEYDVTVLRDDNIMFLRDRNELKKLEKKYRDRVLATGVINLDNFDEALSDMDAQERSIKVSEIIGILSDWADEYDAYIKGYSEKQYIVLMDRKQLDKVINDEFKVIDLVNDYCNKENIRITVSIGMVCNDDNIISSMDRSNELLDLALNRGGNQAVCEIDSNIKYYGGKVKGVDTRVPVYVRVKTEDLCDLIKSSSNVIIMSHMNMDADALGGSIAALKIARALKKDAKICLNMDVIDITCKEVLNEISNEHVGMMDYFIEPNDALSLIDENSLLLLVDCQYQKMLVDEKIFRRSKKVAIIDHHRSNDSAISDYEYLYNKTTSSSSVELLVEMFDYMEEDIDISPIEATIMLLGIIVDTSNLMYRTSYQTFSVLSKLQVYGAEMPKVQRYLREDFDNYIKRINILNNVEMVNNKFGVAVCNDEIVRRDFLAKVADNLIGVDSIKAGFCIGRIAENQIGISARSLDEFNVQMIMERLGGGGHFNNAATQINNYTILEAKDKLIEILKEQENTGEETMKVILIKDVKGKGKANDVIDIPNGHANYLIKSKLAILASPDNLNELERKNEQERLAAIEHLEAMRDLKKFIESNPITIGTRVGKEGRLFGTISTKQIVEEMKNQFDVNLDKRKIMFDDDIDRLGTYEIPIQLHREVVAKIILHVVEKA